MQYDNFQGARDRKDSPHDTVPMIDFPVNSSCVLDAAIRSPYSGDGGRRTPRKADG